MARANKCRIGTAYPATRFNKEPFAFQNHVCNYISITKQDSNTPAYLDNEWKLSRSAEELYAIRAGENEGHFIFYGP